MRALWDMRILLDCNHKTGSVQGICTGIISPLWEQMYGRCHQGENFKSVTLNSTANEQA